ncbi:hypothetical protein PANA5342_1444 [Pantoea ananatis LMG 5342]|nr:hypothetical protein PANA5342_1444 [Pantoea ananatis LMG 5342]
MFIHNIIHNEYAVYKSGFLLIIGYSRKGKNAT